MTHLFYLDERLNNGECHLNWISIDTVRHLLEERLGEPRSYSKTLFCSLLPIRDRHLRINRRWFFRAQSQFSDVMTKRIAISP